MGSFKVEEVILTGSDGGTETVGSVCTVVGEFTGGSTAGGTEVDPSGATVFSGVELGARGGGWFN